VSLPDALINSRKKQATEDATPLMWQKNETLSTSRELAQHFTYVGDSRARHMFAAHARSLNLDPKRHYLDQRCHNNTFRYANADNCLNSENELHDDDGTRLLFRQCWRSSLSCWTQLTDNKLSFLRYLKLDPIHDHVIVVNVGLHDAIYNYQNIQNTYFAGLHRMFTFVSQFDHLHMTWVQPYPLLAPQLGKSAKFENWRDINGRIEAVASKSRLLAIASGIRAFDVREYIGDFTASMSPDTVHLMPDVDDTLLAPLIELQENNDKQASIEKLNHDDFMCGNQSFQLSSSDSITVAALGGSVTSDGSYIQPFGNYLRLIFNKNVTILNFAEPATGSQYASSCAAHSLTSYAGTIDLVMIEFCQNDFDPMAEDLTKLINYLRLEYYVFYYCHLGPRLMNSDNRVHVANQHWALMKNSNVLAFRNKGMMSMVSNNDTLKELLFRDAVHLKKPYGGNVVSELLAVSLLHCAGKELKTRSERAGRNILKQGECYTNLGPKDSRNFQTIVNHSEGWRFVESEHHSTTTGKNGYEATSVGSCISLRATVNVCDRPIFLFYLSSGRESLGQVNVTTNGCDHSQVISGFHEGSPYTHSTRARLSFLDRCCEKTKDDAVKLINVCSIGDKTIQYKFRIIALATG